MKKYNFILLSILTLSFSFLYSDYAKLPIDNTSTLSKAKNKKPAKAKPEKVKPKGKDLPAKEILNQDLKADLTDLENEFKAKRQKLKETYKERRREIYEKYGVKPPVNNRNDSNPKDLKFKKK